MKVVIPNDLGREGKGGEGEGAMKVVIPNDLGRERMGREGMGRERRDGKISKISQLIEKFQDVNVLYYTSSKA